MVFVPRLPMLCVRVSLLEGFGELLQGKHKERHPCWEVSAFQARASNIGTSPRNHLSPYWSFGGLGWLGDQTGCLNQTWKAAPSLRTTAPNPGQWVVKWVKATWAALFKQKSTGSPPRGRFRDLIAWHQGALCAGHLRGAFGRPR